MKKAAKKIFTAICLIATVFSISMTAYSVPEDVQSDIAQVELELTNLAAQSSRAQERLAQARAAEITANAKMLAALDAAINTEKKYRTAMEQVTQAKHDLGGIAQAIYQDSASSLTNAYYLFGAESLNEATARSHAFNQLAGSTEAKIGRLQALEAVAKSLRQEAEKAAQEQSDQANAAQKAAEDAMRYAAEVDTQLKSAEERREDLVVKLAQLRETEVAAERARAAQMESNRAQQAAAEAAAVVAAAQTKSVGIANAEIGETPTETVTVTPASGTNGSEAARNAQAQAELEAEAARRAAAEEKRAREEEARKEAEKQTPAAPAGNSGIGAQIAAFAQQYTGRPYVWGGTSPDTGWDCSGFTSFVFRHFGVNLPRTSSAQYAAYKHREVPASQARPGDLMWWPGHVGIYVGNGMNVAANTPALGTTVSANYGSPKYLRVLD